MSKIVFLVQGSTAEPYEVVFKKEGQVLTCSCTCPAARNNMMCKHRLGILKKKPKGIASNNLDELETVYAWIDASSFPAILQDIKHCEQKVKELEKQFRLAKSNLNSAKQILVELANGELRDVL